MEITGKTRLFELLEKYPQLEDQIIQAAPAFKNLKNPVLRKTVGRLASIEKVAQIGELDTFSFVNLLRKLVGQAEITPGIQPESTIPEVKHDTGDPDWIQGDPKFIVDGTALLAKGDVPLHVINEHLEKLSPGGYILLLTNFEPQPMIDAVKKQNRKYFHKCDPNDPTQHLTYFQ
jgi:hypothetical protein